MKEESPELAETGEVVEGIHGPLDDAAARDRSLSYP